MMTGQMVQRRHSSAIASDPRWHAVVTRDVQADGTFFYSVESTGVYCRPSCPSRQARPENVRFYISSSEAEAAGFRPCKRCVPNETSLKEQHAETIAKACRKIEEAYEEPSLRDLAEAFRLSPWYFHRIFRTVTGVTPKQYASAHRTKTVRHELAAGKTVTAAIYDAGYNSSSRFYERANQALGMRPQTFKAGGKHEDIRFAIGETTLGSILIAHSRVGVCAILLGDNPESLTEDLKRQFPLANLIGGDQSFETVVSRVVGLVEAPSIGTDLPLDIRGSAFQLRVWQVLRTLPVGSRVSYAEIASRAGVPRAVRAVARACAANTLAVAIPCHRVVRSDGSLSGYRWGVERKRELLQREMGV